MKIVINNARIFNCRATAACDINNENYTAYAANLVIFIFTWAQIE